MFRFLGVATVVLVSHAQEDGNPHQWDRKRRCDHVGYTPKCGPCEGIGGIVWSDKASDVNIPACTEEKGPIDTKNLKRPVWGADFTETKSHEILIGKKIDPACFQAFPGNVSTGTNCYKPQECVLTVDFKEKNAMRIDANQAGNAWGVLGNITSVIYHQGEHMWITNTLPLGFTQTICTGPREGGDPAKPPIYPVQYNWVDNLFFVAREKLEVEYGVGSKVMDHWAFGPHHAWTDPSTGIIIRMWQPYNGLQVFEPGTFHVGHDASAFAELAIDGKTAPKLARKKGGSSFRIKCTDDGFPEPPKEVDEKKMTEATTAHKASKADLHRAKTKKPRDSFRGDGFEKMSHTLNAHLRANNPSTRECDLWAVEELQQLQVLMIILRDPALDDVYNKSADNRRIRHNMHEMVTQWETINHLARKDPELARIHRDGHCHEAVMWYVHHLPQQTQDVLKQKATLPLLSYHHHVPKDGAEHTAVHQAYEEKVTCFSCHSNVMPKPTQVFV